MSHRTDVETREASDPQNERSRVLFAMINIWISIMPVLFDLLYREFIRARLAEMKKQLLLWPDSAVIPDEKCDAGHPDDAAESSRERNSHAETAADFAIG